MLAHVSILATITFLIHLIIFIISAITLYSKTSRQMMTLKRTFWKQNKSVGETPMSLRTLMKSKHMIQT